VNRSNPFCTRFVRPGAIPYQFESGAGNEVERIVRQLTITPRGAIVGPHGTGKTTLLMTLMPMLGEAFASAELVALHAPQTQASRIARLRHRRKLLHHVLMRSRSVAPHGIVVVDGFEQLGWLGARAACRAADRRRLALLVTSHRDVPGMATLFRTRLHPGLVCRLTDSLLADSTAAVADAVRTSVVTRDPATVHDLREFWFDLYDVAAERLAAKIDMPCPNTPESCTSESLFSS